MSGVSVAAILKPAPTGMHAGATPSVALAHDYLTQRGGAERVVLAMARAFPAAPLYTSLFQAETTFPEFTELDIRPSPLDRVGRLRRNHRIALPLLAPTFSRTQVDADVVLCSSSGWAHGVRTEGRKIVYCYTPARWLYQRDLYLGNASRSTALALRSIERPLRRWDARAARSADSYLTISTHTQTMIRDEYGIEAEVVHPPVGVNAWGSREPVPGIEPGYVLCVSRLMPYKNIDAVLGAFEQLPAERLVLVGNGPLAAQLQAQAPANVTLLHGVSDDQLRWLYSQASVLMAASYEDFGLTPIEAAAFGVPSVVLRFGGYLDTVVEGETGAFFDEPTPDRIAECLRHLEPDAFVPERIRAHGNAFSEPRFAARLHELVGGDLATVGGPHLPTASGESWP